MEQRRINFAYVGDAHDAYIAAYSEWSARALWLVGDRDDDCRLERQVLVDLNRLTSMTDWGSRPPPPDYRFPPSVDAVMPISAPDDEHSLEFSTGSSVECQWPS